ncbi:MAG: hypothetical protein EBY81_08500, partial [Verrucomicrobia bacterium]|nr:hypothetical protein [Verrucomicrobiota bacterium]
MLSSPKSCEEQSPRKLLLPEFAEQSPGCTAIQNQGSAHARESRKESSVASSVLLHLFLQNRQAPLRTSSQDLPSLIFFPALRIAHPSAIRFNFLVPCPPIRAAVLDLGSNTFKLLLAEQSGSTLRLHHEKAYPVRLGQGVALTGKIQPATSRRALRLLARLQRKIRIFHPSKIIAVATGTLRLARNRQSFLLPASRILGRKISLLTGHTEGRLIALAARQ